MRTLRYLVLLWCLIAGSECLYAQSNFEFHTVTLTQEGSRRALPITMLNDIVQDRDGYMWISRRIGLYRFDGYNAVPFMHDPADSTSIASLVECLYVDLQGTLWVGTYGRGLARYVPRTQSFLYYSYDSTDSRSISSDSVTVILEDGAGMLWIGTFQGLNRFDPETETFTRFAYDAHDSTSLSSDHVRALLEDKAGTLWVGTGSPYDSKPGEGGLNRFDPASKTFQRYVHDPDDETSLSNNWVRTIFEDSRGRFWIGTWGDGLHTMDRERGTFERFTYDPNNAQQLSRPYPAGFRGGGVTAIAEDRAGRLWIGAIWGGINVYDPATGSVSHFEHEPGEVGGLKDNLVWRIFESRDGIIWVATWENLYKVDPTRSTFPLIDPETLTRADSDGKAVYAMAQLPSGELLIGLDIGLRLLDAVAGRLVPMPIHWGTDNRIIDNTEIDELHVDRHGIIWAGSCCGGIGSLDPVTGAVEIYPPDAENPNSPANGRVFDIIEDRDGLLWMTSEGGGLTSLDRSTRTFTRYVHDPQNSASLSSNFTHGLIEDRHGSLWIGTHEFGLNRMNRGTGEFTRFRRDDSDPRSLSDDDVNVIFEDRGGVLWVGTDGGGLNRFDASDGSFTRYAFGRIGHSENILQTILEDDDGRLWINTDAGLIRFRPSDGTFDLFGEEQGYPVRSENLYDAMKSSTGEFFIGGSNGFTRFFPDTIRMNMDPPQVRLLGFRSFPGAEQDDNRASTNLSFDPTKPIMLPHNGSDFAIEFVGLHYSNPVANRYAYMLENYDTEWRSDGSSRSASYFKVSPGEYVFRVKAANADGVWNDEGASVRIVVKPAWWRTWWAYMVYGSLFLGGVVVADHERRNRLVLRARDQARERELEHGREIERAYTDLKRTQQQLVHAEKMASLGALTAGIAHEIKNPLNFVNNFAGLTRELVEEVEEACAAQPDAPVSEFQEELASLRLNAQKIEEHGRRADDIVRSMMQHACGGAGERERVDVNRFVDEYVELAWHGRRAQQADFDLEIERSYDEDAGCAALVPQELGRVLINLLSNAFDAVTERAARENGRYSPVVTVVTERHEDGLRIRIEDNGPGVPAELKDRIFEPFFTTKPTGKGTGLGLSLAYDIVAQGHGGKLTMDSTAGKGSAFVITLPRSASLTEHRTKDEAAAVSV